MLAGYGQRIFGLNVPFIHYASKTVEAIGRETFHPLYARVLRAYAEKWGGGPNEEDPHPTNQLFEEERAQHGQGLASQGSDAPPGGGPDRPDDEVGQSVSYPAGDE